MTLITKLDVDNKEIKDLRGLEFAINLKNINLEGNEIKDISPLENLQNLKDINDKNQKIKLEDFNTTTDSLKIDNPIIRLKDNVINISGKDVSVQDNNIVINNITSNKEIKFNFKDKDSREIFSVEVIFNIKKKSKRRYKRKY